MPACALCEHHEKPDDNVVWQNTLCRVVLVDDADYPGFCRVILHRHVAEMTDLPMDEREQLMRIVWQVESALRDVMAPDKINLAAFGNMVPHLHWHVIPRYRDDVHFPQPTWGSPQRPADPAALAERRGRLPALRQRLATLG